MRRSLEGAQRLEIGEAVEVDTVAQIDAFFAGRPRQWALFEKLRAALCGQYPGTQLRVMKTCISFDDPKPYCYVSNPPRALLTQGNRDALLITFGLRERMDHPRFAQVVPISRSRFTIHVVVAGEEEIDEELLFLIGRAIHRKGS